jgi:NAD-dependent deacetylase
MKKRLVILSGAGISAESGLKTFRDGDGLWNGYDVYEVASPRGWKRDAALVLDFYNMRRKDVLNAKPNAAHIGLAELEKDFDVAIITQNIDDLHERAGSTDVLHLHGEIFKMRAVNDENTIYDIRDDIKLGDTNKHGVQLRPHIVWFDEPVPMIEKAVSITANADIFVVIGTSLQVYPAASLLHYVPSGTPTYIIDKNIAATNKYPGIHFIEKPATEGVEELMRLLL